MSANYVIISPVRDEARFLEKTITSVTEQTVCPRVWFLVNDGSSDETGAIIEEAAKRHDWIRPVHREDRGSRIAGSGVMQAFYDAYDMLDDQSWQYLVKLDGDLSFPPVYFERCLEKFSENPRVGIGSGLICTPESGGQTPEYDDPHFHVRGPAKMYRRECWEDIGGLSMMTGWDTLDIIKANMLGWKTQTFEDIRLIHHRPTGGAYGTWSNLKKNGMANYLVGYHPLFMTAKCVRRTFRKPYGLGAFALMYGFCSGYVKRVKRAADDKVVRYLRREQMRCLMGQASLWR